MRGYRRLVLALAIALVIVIATVMAAVFLLPETELIRNRVREELERVTGHEVVLGALDVRPSFPSLVKLTLRGISIQTKSGKPIMSADKVIFTPDPTSLFRRELAVETIVLDRFHTWVVRRPDGAIGLPFTPVPAFSSDPKPPRDTVSANKEKPPATKAQTAPKATDKSFRWSIRKVVFTKATLEWVDRKITPEKDTRLTLEDIHGELTQDAADKPILIDLSGRLGQAQAPQGTVSLSGSVYPSAGYKTLKEAKVRLRGDGVSLKLLTAYLPQPANLLLRFDKIGVRVDGSLKQGSAPLVSWEADFKESANKNVRLTMNGAMRLSNDLSTVAYAHAKVETDYLPLDYLGLARTETLPLDPRSGVIRAGLRGNWTGDDAWTLSGTVSLEDAAPAGPAKFLKGPLRLWSQFKLDPNTLELEGFEVSREAKLAVLKGRIGGPFTSAPSFDLTGNVAFDPVWAPAIGVTLPPDLKIFNPFQVKGRVTGNPQDLWLDLAGDLASSAISWKPHLEKPSGKKTSLAVKGRLLPGRTRKHKVASFDGEIRLSMIGANIRLADKSPRLNGSQLHLKSKLVGIGRVWSLKETRLAVRRGSDTGDLIDIRGSVERMGSKKPKIDLTADLSLDGRALALAGVDLPRGLLLSGSAPLKGIVSGNPDSLGWSVKLPVTHLDVRLDKTFQKPGGVRGQLEASGSWAKRELVVKSAVLRLPGLDVVGHGTPVDYRGKFAGFSINIKKALLQDVSRYIPAISDMAPWGPAQGKVSFSPGEEQVIPKGAIRLVGVGCKPKGSDLRLDRINGTIGLEGDTLLIDGVTGRASGFLDGPFQVKGELKRVSSTQSMAGVMSVKMEKGRIEAGQAADTIRKTSQLVGTLLDPTTALKGEDPLAFDTLVGDFRIAGQTIRTDNLTLTAKDWKAGAIGAIQLEPSKVDFLAGLRTVVVSSGALGRIPVVKDLIKKHKDVLKITGLDKQLSKLGIKVPEKSGAASTPGEVRTPVTVMLKIEGPLARPTVSPVLADSLRREVRSKLEALIKR